MALIVAVAAHTVLIGRHARQVLYHIAVTREVLHRGPGVTVCLTVFQGGGGDIVQGSPGDEGAVGTDHRFQIEGRHTDGTAVVLQAAHIDGVAEDTCVAGKVGSHAHQTVVTGVDTGRTRHQTVIALAGNGEEGIVDARLGTDILVVQCNVAYAVIAALDSRVTNVVIIITILVNLDGRGG